MMNIGQCGKGSLAIIKMLHADLLYGKYLIFTYLSSFIRLKVVETDIVHSLGHLIWKRYSHVMFFIPNCRFLAACPAYSSVRNHEGTLKKKQMFNVK